VAVARLFDRGERFVLMPLIICMFTLAGCSGKPAAVRVPKVDPDAAAAEAISLYDMNGDKSLSQDELLKCPGMRGHLAIYDKNKDNQIEQDEIAARLTDLFKNGAGATQVISLVKYKGKPLSGAEVVFEPEPYLGNEVQAARGTTNGAGSVDLGIPPEYLPKHLSRVKAVHFGTFKVRVTHPSIPIPAKYNTETEIGYESEIGNPYANFDLK
jgi:hypothetical protein